MAKIQYGVKPDIFKYAQDDHSNSFQEERFGPPHWNMILAICVVADESKCLDTPIFGI